MVRFWVGGYGDAGVSHLSLDSSTGQLSLLGCTPCDPDPSYLCLSPDGRHLLAVHESDASPGVSSFRIDGSGGLRRVSHQPTPQGAGCHVACGHGLALVSCYGTGRLLALGLEEGVVGPVRQEFAYPGGRDASHAHQAVFSRCGGFVHVCDLGADTVWAHPTESGTLGEPEPIPMPFGSGPRHLAWHGGSAWVLGELDAMLHLLPGVDSPELPLRPPRVCLMEPGAPGKGWGAAVRSHRDGLVASLRDPSCLVFVGPSGLQRVATPGTTPRDFAVSPCGGWAVVAHQDSDTVQALRLSDLSWSEPVIVPSPTCVLMPGQGPPPRSQGDDSPPVPSSTQATSVDAPQ